MKKIIITAILLIPFFNINPQGIGDIAPPKPPMVFPPKAWGLDLMIGESVFGFGGFYRFKLNNSISFFTDISFSEAKDDREFEFIDIFGNTYTVGKENRIFQIPINFGAQYRLFEDELTDNLRPYINAGVGPAIVITTPYNKEFFNAFSDAQFKLAAGGYIGFGANFGVDKTNLVGLNFRYYYIRFFDSGVESLSGRPKESIGGFFVTINIGFMHN
jgi:hypothetical protein